MCNLLWLLNIFISCSTDLCLIHAVNHTIDMIMFIENIKVELYELIHLSAIAVKF